MVNAADSKSVEETPAGSSPASGTRDSGTEYNLRLWFKGLLTGKPHHIIGGKEDPYLLRWYLLPRNKRFNLYLHKFLRDDDDRALHDHPWWFISFVLKGSYREYLAPQLSVVRRRFSLAFRPATHRHRVALINNPTWTLILTGPKIREWGFWCPKGFVHWRDFTDPRDSGKTGSRGCE
jgi:hypothetical protein